MLAELLEWILDGQFARPCGGHFGHPEYGRAPRHLVESVRKEGRKDPIRFEVAFRVAVARRRRFEECCGR